MKDENVVGKKMTRNGRKTAIRVVGLGRLLLDGLEIEIFAFCVIFFEPIKI